ncbi:hypothetical protein [Albidovulum sediminis]|uniref:MotA/TolQ/ExbB proton channel domain-containing protein n=1 Tax=Albidovulum sediminis TaxID=3066345 RepID=A0ABT2NG91_9RHOB|nr:hypothetical protein [Defluviimonas sediminis]MCT8327932.1 hypothetical protein [Defluviimonas sediminis]
MEYFFARLVLGLLGLASLALIVIGIFLAVSGVGIGAGAVMRSGYADAVPASLLAAIPGMVITLIGVLLMAVIDHFSATLDTATYSRKLLRIAEEQLRVSKQTLKLGELAQASYAGAGSGSREHPGAQNGAQPRGLLGFLGRKGGAASRAAFSPGSPAAVESVRSEPSGEAGTRGGRDLASDAPGQIEAAGHQELRPTLTSGLVVPATARTVDPDRRA